MSQEEIESEVVDEVEPAEEDLEKLEGEDLDALDIEEETV